MRENTMTEFKYLGNSIESEKFSKRLKQAWDSKNGIPDKIETKSLMLEIAYQLKRIADNLRR